MGWIYFYFEILCIWKKKKKKKQNKKKKQKQKHTNKKNFWFCSFLERRWFGFVSLYNGISIFLGCLMSTPFFWKNSSGNNQPIAGWGYKGVHTFHKSIIQKVNVIVPLEFEHVNFEAIEQLFRHYASGTPS